MSVKLLSWVSVGMVRHKDWTENRCKSSLQKPQRNIAQYHFKKNASKSDSLEVKYE